MALAARAIAEALAWLWLGMVFAISFLEAPLKFRAPGVDLRTGLAIGRLVFRALNSVEASLAVVLAACLAAGHPARTALLAGFAAILALLVQLAVVRPRLTRRSNAVLAGGDGSRSTAHLWYVALEILKVAALVTLGIAAARW
jgi:hypothetical protein